MAGDSKTRHYELVAIFNPDLSDLEPKMADSYHKMIRELGGTITRAEDWGSRTLAYRINNHTKGHYFLINFSSGNPEIVGAVQDALDKDDTVMRTLITKTKGEVKDKSPVMAAIENAEESAKAKA